MKSIEELKQIFLQERIDYWKTQRPTEMHQVKEIINELELIQIIVGKASNSGNETK
jgi:hypothetical protein